MRALNPVGDVLKSIHSLFSNLDFSSEQSKVIWCQAMTKCCQFVECLLSPESVDFSHNLVPQDIVVVLQSLSPIVTLLRDMVGLPLAAPPIMAFWAVCDSTLQSISDSLLHGRNIRPSVAKACYSSIYRLLASTSPSPQELSALIHSPTLKTTHHNTKGSTTKKDAESSVLSPTRQGYGKPSGHHHGTRRSRSSSNISVWDRIIYVLVGFQYLLNGAIGAEYSGNPSNSLRYDTE